MVNLTLNWSGEDISRNWSARVHIPMVSFIFILKIANLLKITFYQFIYWYDAFKKKHIKAFKMRKISSILDIRKNTSNIK